MYLAYPKLPKVKTQKVIHKKYKSRQVFKGACKATTRSNSSNQSKCEAENYMLFINCIGNNRYKTRRRSME